MKKNILLFLVFFVVFQLSADDKRMALIIGNSNYKEGFLRNPVNDAKAMDRSLKELGFETRIYLDIKTTNEMKKIVREFGAEISQYKGVALFYYAGHGLQVGGLNYLVPIGSSIQKESDVEFECYNVEEMFAEIESAKCKTNIIILDACRNNPFAFSRSTGNRGLRAVERSPSSSLIAFATSPGNVASDGEGENGLYTQELIKAIKIPNLSLAKVFMEVRNNVSKLSNKSQIPWETSSLFEDFYFFSNADLQKRIEEEQRKVSAEADKKKLELEEIERMNAELMKKIKDSKNEKDRIAMEIELQKKQAEENLKKIELENAIKEKERIKREIAKQKEEEIRKKAEEEEKLKLKKEEEERLAKLNEEAEKKKLEYEKLLKEDESTEGLIDQIEELVKGIKDIESTMKSRKDSEIARINRYYNDKISEARTKINSEFLSMQAEPWESDSEFQARKNKYKRDKEIDITNYDNARNKELSEIDGKISTDINKTTRDLIGKKNELVDKLETTVFTIAGKDVSVIIGGFEKNDKYFPFTIKSNSIKYSYSDLYKYYLKGDIATEYKEIVANSKAGYYVGEISYGMKYDDSNWNGMFYGYKIKNLKNNSLVNEKQTDHYKFVIEYNKLPNNKKIEIKDFLLEKKGFIFVSGGTVKSKKSNYYNKNVNVSDFWIGKYEITIKEWVEVMECYEWDNYSAAVATVSWYDCIEYCNKRSINEGLTTVYTIDKSRQDPNNKNEDDKLKYTVTANWNVNGYRLLTEAEWEYAATGGQISKNFLYSGAGNIDKVAWYASNSNSYFFTKSVGLKSPNELGLYDMSGNVSEWCWDWYGNNVGFIKSNPIGCGSGSNRVVRGGSHYGDYRYCEVSNRGSANPSGRNTSIGFRVARSLK
ncbi:MAG: SUMF1/EgtB/PvdO family nonheme iron enzyme [Spirochaetes bacterium]|nr:SUMF1/EgtB/PvdO family nonheme iron enzyme [Spirochaetota bacterium]